ncbi:MAG: UvrD-helicase domain-containing protein [Cyclobacteriaceae bacterium]|jgi:ATP-dependent exoDNAse (exonuclease V) beta subunit|nr:UvrD-helicase domain-containing protein [Cyclobacteriaceae bacterium]
MNKPVFSVYRSSAGSGKTRTLAKEYLLLALRNQGDYYKHILAVTFTNKATQEMKSRIVSYLVQFSKGNFDSLATELMNELALQEDEFVNRCKALQVHILHHYGNFGISTIDTFFQKIIRAFTRESGLAGDFTLELDTQRVVDDVVSRMIAQIGKDEKLTQNIIAFAKGKLEDGKPWNIHQELADFANEIFKEEFRLIEDEVFNSIKDPNFFSALSESLFTTTNSFFSRFRKLAKEIETKIIQNNLGNHKFKYGKPNAFNFVKKLLKLKNDAQLSKEFSVRAEREFLTAEGWTDDKPVQNWIAQHILPTYQALVELYHEEGNKLATCQLLIKNYHNFSLLVSFIQELKTFKEEQNILLLSDSPKLLNNIIAESDTPFIYEKAGSFYKNFLIDEFQDTSLLQWKNFKPLILNSIDQGYNCAVVGDVKQSIYRWRGGELELLQNKVIEDSGDYRSSIKQLNTNYRSSATIVDFNNELFNIISNEILPTTGVEKIYADVKQHISKQEPGEVNIHFFEKKGNSNEWKEQALAEVSHYLIQLQDKKISLRDVAILVRSKADGQLVANYLLTKAKENSLYKFDVISNESLLVAQATAVQLIVACLNYLQRPDHLMARTNLLLAWNQIQGLDITNQSFSVSNSEIFENQLPKEFTKSKSQWRKLPLYELIEKVIGVFRLYERVGEQLHIQTFLNHALEFTGKDRNSLHAFLNSWEWQSTQLSIQVSDQVNAIRIITVHKAKGLQYPIVIIPFCDWNLDNDKAPLLWVKSNIEILQVGGYLPVRYGKDLEQTIFADDYFIEKRKALLDNINLLYVALTRAEKAMWIGAPLTKSYAENKSVADLIFNSLNRNEAWQANWKIPQVHWQTESQLPNNEIEKIESNKFNFIYPVFDWRKRLVLRTSIDNPFLHTNKIKDQRFQGVRLHKVLQAIQYKQDVENAIENAISIGLFSIAERDFLVDAINKVLSNDSIKQWFESDWKVSTEVSILLPSQGEKRLDRLMVKENKVIILDYKSGEERKEDIQQMKEYLKIVKAMFSQPVKGYLFYLFENKLIEIKQVSGNNRSQLQLDM